MNTPFFVIVQRFWTCGCNVLSGKRRRSVVGDVSCGDDVESAVEVGLARAAWLRQTVLWSAFERRL